jgi:hypothetical protein
VKRSNLPKFLIASCLATGMTILPFSLPTLAQADSPVTTPDEVYEDNNFDWGWLGLLGLIGLAGLAGKKRHDNVNTYNDPSRATRTTFRE